MTRRHVVLIAAALAGCGEEPPRGVQYWLAHPLERAAKLAECRESAAADAEHNARFNAFWRDRLPKGDGDPWLTSSQR